MDFSRQHRRVYICGELDNTVTVLRYNPAAVPAVLAGGYTADSGEEGALLTALQTVSTVPAGLDSRSTIAEMRLHPSGRFLYVGNRGHNSIAVFRVDPVDGALDLLDIQDSHGAFPRHFNFDRTSEFLIVGNHASDTIVAFRILENGRLVMVDKVEDIPSIVWVTPVCPA